MANEKILDKIKRIISLQESAITLGNEEEAKAAALAATRLLAAYNLTMIDVNNFEQKELSGVLLKEKERKKGIYKIFDLELTHVIAKYSFCKLLFTNEIKTVVGTEENVSTVLWLSEYLFDYLKTVSIRKRKNVELEYRNVWAKSFLRGCVRGIKEQLEVERRKSTNTVDKGLVVLHEEKVDEFINENIKHKTVKQRTSKIDAAAWVDGLKTGREVSINKQVV